MKNGLEKQELFKHIWNIANDLRGKVSGWEFQSYILGTIFYRYLSENYVKKVNDEQISLGAPLDFDYSKLVDEDIDNSNLDKKEFIAKYGFFLYPSELFTNVLNKAKKEEINISETLNKVFKNIEESTYSNSTSNEVFKNLFDSYDVNSISLGETVEKRNNQLTKLLSNIGAIDFGNEFTENTSDMLGDAYEFLIGMYAANAGKSGGEYFTPQEVSTLLTKIGLHNQQIDDNKTFRVYDPTCGSGSLLLKSRKILHKDNIEFYGQESNPTTFNLCRMNMVLHNVKMGNIHIACEDTLISPKHNDIVEKTGGFDLIVSNPPYSVKWDGKNNPLLIDDPRYSPAGVLAPSSKADLAFVLHSLHYLNNTGKAAIVCFPGVMYRGNAEQKIREYLIKNNYVDTVIQMPNNLFFGTSIATSILILNKAKIDQNILFVDGSNDCVQDTNNRLSEQNIEDLLKIYQDRQNVTHKASLISNEEVLKNKSTLAVSTYVSIKDNEEKINIDDLNKDLNETATNINYLRNEINEIQESINRIVFNKEKVIWERIGDIGKFYGGLTNKNKQDFIEGNKRFITYKEVFNNLSINIKDNNFEKNKVKISINEKQNTLKKGDIIFTGSSETLNESGMSSVIIDEPEEELYLNSFCFFLRLNEPNILLPGFCKYLFRTDKIRKKIIKTAKGATRYNVSKKDMENIFIPIPPLFEQQRIVDFLDKLTELQTELQMLMELEKRRFNYHLNYLMDFENN